NSELSIEMDDQHTSYELANMVERSIDFDKTLVLINIEDADTTQTLEATAKAINEAAAAQLPIMLEPFMSNWVNNKVVNDLSPDAVIQPIGIAAGLGNDSSYTWMKLPVVEAMERVMAATTMPTLPLGRATGGAPDATSSSRA